MEEKKIPNKVGECEKFKNGIEMCRISDEDFVIRKDGKVIMSVNTKQVSDTEFISKIKVAEEVLKDEKD